MEMILKQWDTEEWLTHEAMLLPYKQPLREAQGLAQVIDRLMKEDFTRWQQFVAAIREESPLSLRWVSVGGTQTQPMWRVRQDTLWPVGTVLERGDEVVDWVTQVGVRWQQADGTIRMGSDLPVSVRRWLRDQLVQYFQSELDQDTSWR